MFNALEIAMEIESYLRQQAERATNALHFGGVEMKPFVESDQTPVGEEIKLLVACAAGDVPADGEVAETIQSLCEVLFAPAWCQGSYDIPAWFWRTALGELITHCQALLAGDDLITHSEAAKILYGKAGRRELDALRRLIEAGVFGRYRAPGERNRRKAGRVRRSEVEQYCAPF